MCLRYRRHCLYEKHSRTPLTRRHLTEVEERLEQAEALIRQLRATQPPQTLLSEGSTNVLASPNQLSEANTRQFTNSNLSMDGSHLQQSSVLSIHDGLASDSTLNANIPKKVFGDGPMTQQIMGASEQVESSDKSQDDEFESPPSTGDFGWNEHGAIQQILDGMASLTVSEQRTDTMIDAYFRIYHLSYPIVHEPTFRAQYSEVIRRPNGGSWYILAYVMAALGVYTTATDLNNLDLDIFQHTKSLLTFDILEVGSLTMVQALTLISNYQQKRDKPNSAYSYSGLAARMAMALGLHKDFQGWKIPPLSMEIRRRVWWTMSIFDIGATITFGRPQVCPFDGVDIALPRNVHDKDLTAMSSSYPPDPEEITVYTAVRTQARFFIATNPIYLRIISKPLPSARELLQLEAQCIGSWAEKTPSYFSETAAIPPTSVFSHSVMQWRWRNFRMIMYRPFVIRRALLARSGRRDNSSPESLQAYERCLEDAKQSILSISAFWAANDHNRLFAWYALYFLFQAALIPCICLQNESSSSNAPDWRDQIVTSLKVIAALVPVNPSARRCYQVLVSLCGAHLDTPMPLLPEDVNSEETLVLQSEDVGGFNSAIYRQASDADGDRQMMSGVDSNDQMNAVFGMMWPNTLFDTAEKGHDDSWMDFLNGI
ncbi:fungal specific transcription factor domain-containing protein [Trichoderma breve]|uniref:Fungal specific transcription factor domain-containing protein n=1 Tax=Trichoderma breve TaxID=2034170 RepID=A0A9W9EB91_9HYPO|nr:fungal specific transcription factor domain-containing protein [Trichoderma breve]KAJ4863530.1 fungal specific transcription factor domain-containing protein [Trichoderma breve]